MKNKRKFLIGIVLCGIIFITFYIFIFFRIEKISISGCDYYTEDEIKSQMIQSAFDHNGIFLYLKYKLGKGVSIPFVDEIDVALVSNHGIEIRIYEKTIIACIKYMGEYLYFDKDGIIVESSVEKRGDVPLVSGVVFTKMNLHEKLEVEESSIFNRILDLSQLIKRYHIPIDEIVFDRKQQVNFIAKNITVQLGKRDTYDEAVAELSKLLPKAIDQKLKGVLDMENFEEGQETIIFKEESGKNK